MNCYLSIDVDDVAYANELGEIDELNFLIRTLAPLLIEQQIKATWFIRIDKKVAVDYGRADHFLAEYAEFWQMLKAHGHAIGWHPHCYTQIDGKWQQNSNESEVLAELNELLPQVKAHGLDMVRMGWGFVTNKVMTLLADNFKLDASAIPRPSYPWEISVKDWHTSGHQPYYPSKEDYRVGAEQGCDSGFHPILEVPMSTAHIAAKNDTGEIIRYINPAFYRANLEQPLRRWIAENDSLVLIMHPYEVMPSRSKHGLICFDIHEMLHNIESVKQIALENGKTAAFLTLSEFIK